MLAGGTDALYRQILASNHTPVHRVEVWRGGVRVDDYGPEGLPIVGGSVTATLTSRVTRDLTLTVPEELFPDDPEDPAELLTPWGNELRVFAGTGGAPGYIWPAFRGKIGEANLDDLGTVTAQDRAMEVGDDPFLAPRASTVGIRILDEWRKLIVQTLPDAQFGTSDGIWELVPKLTWENDRAGACDDLARAAAALWYCLADGSFVMRRPPWSTTAGTPVITLSDGDGGTIRNASIRITREDVANIVSAIGERADATAPAYATASDQNPTSTTYVDGPFGRKGRLVRAQGAATYAQAATVAASWLRRTKSLGQSWSTSMVPDASLELGDVATLRARRKGNGNVRTAVQVVASFSLPLTGTDLMNVSWRGQEPPVPGVGE